MRLVIKDNQEEVALYAATYIKNSILAFNPGPGKLFVLGLPTGKLKHFFQTYTNSRDIVCFGSFYRHAFV